VSSQSSKAGVLAALFVCILLASPAARVTAPPVTDASGEHAKRLPGLEAHLSAQELQALRTQGLSVEPRSGS
jgi:hypothetical protein